MRVILDAREILGSGGRTRHLRFWERRAGLEVGKKVRAGRSDLAVLLDVVLLLALAIACLFTSPYLAMPCFTFPLSLSFSSSPIPLEDGWKDGQVLSTFLQM